MHRMWSIQANFIAIITNGVFEGINTAMLNMSIFMILIV
jgi:hypothetical protein